MAQRKVRPAANDSRRVRTVEIHTLGQFQLNIGGRPVEFRRKIQRRPLELLKALIALGRPAVGAPRLMDALWSETEGDQAHRCLATTLYRLRELLRAKEAVLHVGGQLALNPRYCWVDVWALERQLLAIDAAGHAPFPDTEALSRRHHETARLYRGDFLDADRGYPWTESLREQLRTRYLRVLRAWGQSLQQLDRYEEAAAAYHKGLDVNPLAEDCYCQLMCCLAVLGRRTEAVLLYRRCCAVLQNELGLQPAPETRSLYLSLRQEEAKPDNAAPRAAGKYQFIDPTFTDSSPFSQSLKRPNR
jgi:DNA-binding SARP family transcriptional activator